MPAKPTAVLALEVSAGNVASTLRSPEELAAAFLAGYGTSTREAYARDLRDWGWFLAAHDVDVMEAHRVHVDAFVRDGEREGLGRATLARRLSALSGFYAYALDEGLIARSPVARVRIALTAAQASGSRRPSCLAGASGLEP
jgi:site-specific recombinase XerD